MIDLRLLRFIARGVVLAAISGGHLIFTSSAHAAPLDPERCGALKTEHADLLAEDIKADLAKGPAWAKDNLGQLRLQKIKRLIEVEESIAFRCRGTPLMTAVVIPSLVDVKPSKQITKNSSVAVRARGALRVSRVPPPVRRPGRPVSRSASPPAKAADIPRASKTKPEATLAKRDVSAPTLADSETTKSPSDKKTLPKVIRLQPSKANPKPKNNVRRVRKKPRRKLRRRAADAYTPPPPNPAYQPSLTSP